MADVLQMPRTRQVSLSLLIEAVERLAGAENALDVAAIVRTAARKLTGADGISVVLRDGDRVRYVDEDAVSPLWKGQDFPIENRISGWAILNNETVVIEDITGDPRIPLAAYQPTFVKSLAIAPVRIDSPIAAIGAYWATARRPTDEEIDALETMARATAVALENTRLRAELKSAADDARAADAAKSAFLANMSHEIRTPLNGIVALAHLLNRTQLDDKQKEMTQLITTSSDHLVSVVSDILDFAKVESGKHELNLEPFDLQAAVRNCVEPLAARAKDKGVAFDLHIAPELRGVFVGDEQRVTQVLANLVSNAVKFTETGHVEVRIAEGDRVGAKPMILFRVADTGIGFDDSVKATLFERFTQADASMTRRYGGSGLGMAIVDALVRVMQGRIEVRSKLGQGSVFSVLLPLERVEQPHEADDIVFLEDLDPDRGKPSMHILCAEDNPTNQAVIRMSLASLNAEIVMVENGELAVAAAFDKRPDVILMDMQMPIMDGLEATRQIRARENAESLPHAPIVMVTAHAMRQHVSSAFLAGVDGFVAKPATPEQLLDAIKAAVATRETV